MEKVLPAKTEPKHEKTVAFASQVDDAPVEKNPPPLAGSLTGADPSAGAIDAYPDAVYDAHAADNSENEHRRMVKAKQAARKA